MFNIQKDQLKQIDTIANNITNFVNKLFQHMTYQLENPQQIQKTSFIRQNTDGQRIFKLKIKNQLFIECKFAKSKIDLSTFENCEFTNCNFSKADLLKVQFINCIFNNCNFSQAKLIDVKMIQCKKFKCTFDKIQLNNSFGINEQDQKIIQDSIQYKGISKNGKVYQLIKQILVNWNEIQPMCFQLCGSDQNCGLAIYPNEQKNSQITDDMWQFVFFYGNQSILMNDFNLYGKSKQQLENIINTWKNEDLVIQSETIIKNILTIIQEK